ncbi:MAG: helix-turn-helix transcriptional regulator [Erysipelotrichaceae bacterium]|nr:helix-turn-helix transcriptional regulator [Erysipelotrichaceae bacterium]
MTLGQKLKEIRKRFGLSQEQLAEIMNVSRQAITKWETDTGMPDVGNLMELSKVFGITVDYLLKDENHLPSLSMRKQLDAKKYPDKLSSYSMILKEYYPAPWEVFVLSPTKKINGLEGVLNVFTAGSYWLIKDVSDLSPYYLVKKDQLKLLVNIRDWTMEVMELPSDTNDKRFSLGTTRFVNCGKLKL